jgi:hypothetical protein
MLVAEQNAHLRCVSACAIIQNTLEQLRILNRPFGLWEKETGSLCVEVLQEKQEREREREKLDISSHLLGHHKINAQSLHQQVHIPGPFLSNCGLGIVRLMSLSTCWHPP